MQNNPVLEEFISVDNPLEINDRVNRICKIVKEHPFIHTIELDGCCNDDMNGYEVLCSVFTAGKNTLKSIDFSTNDVSSKSPLQTSRQQIQFCNVLSSYQQSC